jgi:aspartate racemase
MCSTTPSRCIGLIGGLGVGASVYYYQELAKAHAAQGRILNLVLAHADVDRVLGAVGSGDRAGLANYLAALISRLSAAGAEFAVIPAVAPHIAIAEIKQLSQLPVVSLIDELQREIEARKLRRVTLFGTRFAVESRLFGQLHEVDVVLPRAEEIEYIHSTYLQLVSAGAGLAAQRDGLTRLAHTLIERENLDAVVFAGTELALVFDASNADFPHISSARLHLDAVVRRALDLD